MATTKGKVEAQLRAERDKLSGILSSLEEGVVIIGPDYRVYFQNKLLLERFGDLMGKLCYEGYMGRSEPCEPCPMVKALRTNRTQSVELVAADGRHYEVTATPFVDSDGDRRAIEVLRDITERKRAEEALRESEEKYRIAMETARDGIYIAGLDGTLLDCNRAFIIGLGFDSKEEILGRSILDFATPDTRQKSREAMETVAERGYIINLEVVALARDGREFPVELNVSLLRGREGEPAGFVLTARDITRRKRAEGEIQRYTRRVEALHAIAQTVSGTLDMDRMLRSALKKVVEALGVDMGYIVFLDTQAQETVLKAHHGLSAGLVSYLRRRRVKEDEIRRWLEYKGPVFGFRGIPEEQTGARVAAMLQQDGVQSVVVMPFWCSGRLQGGIALGARSKRRFTPEEMELLQAISNQIAIGIENASLYQEATDSAERIAVISELTRIIGSSLDIREVYQTFAAQLKKIVDFDRASIALVEGGNLRFFAVSSEVEMELGDAVVIPLKNSVTEWVIENRMAHITTDVARRRQFYTDEIHLKSGLRSAIRVPLFSKGEVFGTFNLSSRRPGAYGEREREVLEQLAGQIAVALENSRLFEEVSNLATTDALTGLFNHGHFYERLEEEIARIHRFGGECSLVMLDLDFFKMYNDLFGHLAGDEVLKRMGQVLRDYTRQVDIPCRYGGEEFTIILPQTGPSDAYQAAERLRRAIEKTLSLEGGPASTPLTVSLGVSSCPGDGVSGEELLRRANLAMREAKSRGRNQTCLASGVPSAAPAGEESLEVAEHLESASLNTIYALAAAVDARDHYTYGHSRDVSRYAVAIGKALGLSRRQIKQLRIAALLHDIGKIGLSDSIIRKPGPLNEEEWQMMRKHSELGATIISHTPELAYCAPAIRHHHEWQDGSGYPDGLKGEAIPLEARIIAIADAYDTMTTPRCYRETLSVPDALRELERCAGTQFDPHLVDTFARVINQGSTP